MKTIKRLTLVLLVLALVGGAVYLPASRHVVVFDGKSHVVQKDKVGWDNTYLNLDKEPLKWRVVFQSKTLKEYFLKHYAKVAQLKAKKYAANWWQRMKQRAAQTLKRSGKWIEKEGPKALKKLGKKAKEGIQKGVQAAKEKSKELMK